MIIAHCKLPCAYAKSHSMRIRVAIRLDFHARLGRIDIAGLQAGKQVPSMFIRFANAPTRQIHCALPQLVPVSLPGLAAARVGVFAKPVNCEPR